MNESILVKGNYIFGSPRACPHRRRVSRHGGGIHTDPPPTSHPLATLAAEAEGPEVGSVEEQRKHQGYFVRLGSLSARLRHLAYEHSLGKLRQKKHHAQDTLAQLQETLELVRALCLPLPYDAGQ